MPPFLLTYNASSVPIIQLGLSGRGLSEQALFDYGTNFIRTRLVTIPGCAIPYPYGGKQRQIMVDINPAAMQSKGLSPADITTAVGNQNLIIPAGTSKIGQFEYDVDLNSSPTTVEAFNDFPIKVVNGSPIYIRDIGHVRDGFAPQTNIVRQDGSRGVLLTVMKGGNASTLDVVDGVRKLLPSVSATLPPELKIQPLADQSIFVRASINGVIREAVIAACLTGLMILLFLGSWRSTLIIAVSIPLSILTSIIVLSFLHETINIMTLGGLALAVGILVDDATVDNRKHRPQPGPGQGARAGHPGRRRADRRSRAGLHAVHLHRVPAHVLSSAAWRATCSCRWPKRWCSPCWPPTSFRAPWCRRWRSTCLKLAAPRAHAATPWCCSSGRSSAASTASATATGPCWPCWFTAAWSSCRFSSLVCCSGFLLYPWLGQDFFPASDAGQFKLHLRAKTGTRIEETARICDLVEQSIRRQIPRDQLLNILDDIGLPYSSINTIYSNSAPMGPADADILVSLTKEHRPTEEFVRALRASLPREFPGTDFYFLPADIVSQILNFGLPAPIDVQVIGKNVEANRELADRIIEPDAPHPRHRRPAHPAGLRPAQAAHLHRPHQGRRERLHAERRGPEPADLAERQFPDAAHLLAQPAKRRQLQRGHAGAAVRRAIAAGRCATCRSRWDQPGRRKSSTTSPPSAAATAWPW